MAATYLSMKPAETEKAKNARLSPWYLNDIGVIVFKIKKILLRQDNHSFPMRLPIQDLTVRKTLGILGLVTLVL